MGTPLNYGAVRATRISEITWANQPSGYRWYERTLPVGRGEADWMEISNAVMNWEIKTRSGFQVEPANGGSVTVREGCDYTLHACVGPFEIEEPVRVVEVVETPSRCGFAYGTKPGHPVSGEEAFVAHRRSDDTVLLTLRSLTRPGTGHWRCLFPGALLAQRWYRARYARALRLNR
jgi:uncharacterized protein (UPF0548 family)